MQLVGDLNRLYCGEPAMHEKDNQPGGFDWIDCSDADQSIVSVVRRGKDPHAAVVAVFNFTPVPRNGYRVGLPGPGYWSEILNTDAGIYSGSNVGNNGGVHAELVPCQGQPYSAQMRLPPLGAVFFKGSV